MGIKINDEEIQGFCSTCSNLPMFVCKINIKRSLADRFYNNRSKEHNAHADKNEWLLFILKTKYICEQTVVEVDFLCLTTIESSYSYNLWIKLKQKISICHSNKNVAGSDTVFDEKLVAEDEFIAVSSEANDWWYE